MPYFSTRQRIHSGSEIGIPIGTVLVRHPEMGDPDDILFESGDFDAVQALIYFLEEIGNDPLYLIPDSQAQTVLLTLADRVAGELTAPFLIREHINPGFLPGKVKDVLDKQAI